MKLDRRRTARHATMVEAMAAGTLKMMAMIAFKLRSMNDVAIALATKLHKVHQACETRHKEPTHATKK